MASRRHLPGAAAALALALIAAPAASQDREGWPGSLSLGTASIGGTYFVYGAGWAQIVQEELGIPIGVENTGGPIANATLVHSGQLPLGQVTLGPAYDAWTGESPAAPGVRHDRMRALFPMYETPVYAVTPAADGVDSIRELDGLTIGVGPATGTAGVLVPRFLDLLGVEATYRNASYGETATQINDGLLDGMVIAAGLPTPNVTEMEARRPVSVFSFDEGERAKILEAFPFMAPFAIPAGTYAATPEPVETVAVWNFAIAGADLPDDLAYAITKAVLENRERLENVHPAAATTRAENIVHNSFLPFHPGAIRYYEEIGLTVPDAVRP